MGMQVNTILRSGVTCIARERIAIAIASSIPVVARVLRFFKDFAESINKLKKLFII